MEYLTFSNGDKIPAIGLGTWKSSKGQVGKTIATALEVGYRHLDCAADYDNEAEIGWTLKKIFSEGKIKREEIWITSKLWNDSHKKKDVLPALQKSLNDLQVEYFDLYLIHWPVAFRKGVKFPLKDEDYLSLEEVPLADTWDAMVEAKKKGLVKHIGVSNFSEKKLGNLLAETTEPPEMNQVELHPYLQQPQLVEFCTENNILVTAYSPLGSGDRIKEMKAPNEPSLLNDSVIRNIAEKRNATPAEVLIKWAVTRGTAVIPKSTSPEHLKANLGSLNINLQEEDMKQLAKLDNRFRYVNGEFFVTEGNPYENIYDL